MCKEIDKKLIIELFRFEYFSLPFSGTTMQFFTIKTDFSSNMMRINKNLGVIHF